MEISHCFSNVRLERKLFTTTRCSRVFSQGACCSLLCCQLPQSPTPGNPGANSKCSPLFGPICLGAAVMNHGALRNIRIWPDPDAVAQECSVLKHRARPREGTGLLENTWAPPYDSVVVHWALLCRAALSFFMAPHICFFFYVTRIFVKGPCPWNSTQP